MRAGWAEEIILCYEEKSVYHFFHGEILKETDYL